MPVVGPAHRSQAEELALCLKVARSHGRFGAGVGCGHIMWGWRRVNEGCSGLQGQGGLRQCWPQHLAHDCLEPALDEGMNE